jgi:hypothetical protein
LIWLLMTWCCRCDSSHRRERRLKTQSLSHPSSKQQSTVDAGTQQTWLDELDSTISASGRRSSNHTERDSVEKREGGGSCVERDLMHSIKQQITQALLVLTNAQTKPSNEQDRVLDARNESRSRGQ